jgi:GDP-4-dehydro-6-deoxy-D-mannose reductase
MKILITGITGTVGSFLARALLSHYPDAAIYGTYRWRSPMEKVEELKNRVQLRECDMRDGSSVRKLMGEVMPDHIYHLAAQSSVVTSRHAPADTLSTNIVGLINLFDAVRELNPKARILVPGSVEEYGFQAPSELPIKETNVLRPTSPYGVSKIAQDMAAYQYAESYKLDIVRTRAFNHTGPGRESVFVESNFALQIAEIEAGKRAPVIEVGNLDIVRDYTDVRDVVRAYIMAMDKGLSGDVYNICSGRGRTIREMLDVLLSYSDIKPEIRIDEARVRAYDAPAQVGDCSKFEKATGWKPEIAFEQTLRDILEYWRARTRANHDSKSALAPA